MLAAAFQPLKLKTQLENLKKAPTLENANVLLREIKAMENQNFQLVQDVFLTTLLTLMEEANGLKKNEIKTALIQCINLILNGSRIMKDLPYRATLMIVLRQIFDFPTNSYNLQLSEELKIAVFDCFTSASRHLDYDAVEAFMVEENKILLSQSIFVCKEAIVKEKYSKLRNKAVEALMSLMQLHDKADFTDVVLRHQISKIVFIVLPQISAVLIKTCIEETIKGSSLVQSSTKALGRFLCLVFEDYERRPSNTIKCQDFIQLVKNIESDGKETTNVLEAGTKSQADFIANLKRSAQWLQEASKRLAPALVKLKSLRGTQHKMIRLELATLSYSLLHKCLPNIQSIVPFLLENLIVFADDSEIDVRQFSQASMRKLFGNLQGLNQEISELFATHLTAMPRIIMTGDEAEQIAGFTLLNSFILIMNENDLQLSTLLYNPVLLEKFMNLMLSCCEIEVTNDLLFFENLASESLQDQFYHMKMPWKQFRNLKNDAVIKKFNEICHNIGKSSTGQMCVNYLVDNINSIEYLVLIIEIINCGDSLALPQDQIEMIMEEFLNETYWTMKIAATHRVERKSAAANEEWFKDNTLGLYESAIEVRLRDVALNEDEKVAEMNLKTIKYNILCTCFVVEMVATTSQILGKNFQRFLLRTLHRVLEKAGSSNFLIRSAGIYAIESITTAMGYNEVSQLIDGNSDYLLFNIQKMLKRSQEDESVLDMLAAVFKFSQSSMTNYIKDIVETSAERLTNDKLMKNTLSYLKLFRLYAGSIRHWDKKSDEQPEEVETEPSWDEFLERCLHELNHQPETDEESFPQEPSDNEEENADQETATDEPAEANEEVPEHIQLVIKMLSSSLQFFSSTNPSEVILTHEIFIDSFPTLQLYEDQFLPMVHQMWYPFTKQFQVKDQVILQYSFRLLVLIARFAKSFIHKRSTDDVIPVLNKFLTQKQTSSYTQSFKLQREILSEYGSLAIDLDLQDKDLDCIVDLLLKFTRSSNELLASASNKSLEVIRKHNPGLVHLKTSFS